MIVTSPRPTYVRGPAAPSRREILRLRCGETGWTTVDPPSLSLAPGARQMAEVTITVPRTAGPGERYGVVWEEAQASAPDGGGIVLVNRAGVRFTHIPAISSVGG